LDEFSVGEVRTAKPGTLERYTVASTVGKQVETVKAQWTMPPLAKALAVGSL